MLKTLNQKEPENDVKEFHDVSWYVTRMVSQACDTCNLPGASQALFRSYFYVNELTQ